MSMSLVGLAAASDVRRQLPMPDYMFGVIGLVAFGLLLAILWTFRNSGNKYRGGHGDRDVRR